MALTFTLAFGKALERVITPLQGANTESILNRYLPGAYDWNCTIYKLARILGIYNLRSAIYKLIRFIKCAQQHTKDGQLQLKQVSEYLQLMSMGAGR